MDGVENKGFDGDEARRLAQIQADPQRALQHIRYLESKVAKLEEEKRLDRAQRFGASSEAGDHQYRLFDEAEAHQEEPDSAALDGADLVEVPAHTKRRPKRKPLPADVPRVVVTHELPEAEKVCGCGCQMQVIGEKVSGSLAVAEFDLKKLLAALGQPAPVTADPDALGAVALSAELAGTTSALEVRPLSLTLDDSKLEGGLSLGLGAPLPAVRFDLALDAIDADRYLPPPGPDDAPAKNVDPGREGPGEA